MSLETPIQIHTNSEIWTKSKCWQQELAFVHDLYLILEKNHYLQIDQVSRSRSRWQRADKQIIVSMVDDLCDYSRDKSADTPYVFDSNVAVITDNYVNCPTQFQIYQVPTSFYGI